MDTRPGHIAHYELIKWLTSASKPDSLIFRTSNATTLRGAASIVRNGRDIFYLRDVKTGSL